MKKVERIGGIPRDQKLKLFTDSYGEIFIDCDVMAKRWRKARGEDPEYPPRKVRITIEEVEE